jgi:hypothetical protein
MTSNSRRRFINGTTLGAIGAVAALSSSAASGQSSGANANGVAGFGWEMSNLNNNGADAYFLVSKQMILSTFNIDVAFMLTSPPPFVAFAEVLCQAAVSRGGPPAFTTGQHAYLDPPTSADFGPVAWYNPNGMPMNGNQVVFQDLFYSVILKSWVPIDGTASSASRQVLGQPSLLLNVGDYLTFHVDHAGLSVDGEMQVVLGYTLV